jgi:D-cysteine desulfhydrase
LHERFPALTGVLDRVPLGKGPTPVRPMAGLSATAAQVWLKNDGLYGGLWGGNKARKLEWILADALRRRRKTIVTFGAIGTNHGLATALYARDQGLRTVLLLVDQPLDDHVRAQFARLERSGATIYRTRSTVRTIATIPWAMVRHADLRARRLPYFLTVGGSSAIGAIGHVEAALELAEQVARGELPEPSHLVVALGSGGTAAGVALGLKLAGLRTRVVAVVVNDKLKLEPRVVARLAERAGRLLRSRGADLGDVSIHPRDIDVERGWLGAGYGHVTEESERAREVTLTREGLALEPVYTAKAVAALLALNERGAFGDGPVLYWHTHNALGAPNNSLASLAPLKS